jgi:hypothetical protein
MMHAQRGQALIETAVFLPIALVLMFAVLYFARFGILEERAQSAVRYGATVSYEGSATYGAAQIYSTIAANAAPSGLCPAAVVTDTVSTLNGSRSGSLAQGFWKTDSVPAATCSITTAGFTAASTDAYRYLSVTTHNVSGTLLMPSYLSATLGANGTVSASLGYVHTASPALIMYCTSHVGASVVAALGGTYTVHGNC